MSRGDLPSYGCSRPGCWGNDHVLGRSVDPAHSALGTRLRDAQGAVSLQGLCRS